MPARLQSSRSPFDLILKSDTDRPICLMLDRRSKGPLHFSVRYLPTEAGQSASIPVRTWTWQNGPGGAGTTLETPLTASQGASEYGEFVWLRRIGVAQPAGRLVELTLPPNTGALTDGQITSGRVYGGHLVLTTLRRYIVVVTDASPTGAITERDVGAGGLTVGTAVFDGSGVACLYVGNALGGIQEWDGVTWRVGDAALTRRAWLETPYWVIGSQLATGGLSTGAGSGADRLVGTDADGTGFWHVAGDPKVGANWSAFQPVGVGGTAYPIRRTVASNRVVWFSTGLGVMSVDELGYTPNLTKFVELYASLNNGYAATYWAGLLWYATELGLTAFTPNGDRLDVPTPVGFGGRNGTMPIFGRPQALAPSPDGLYAAYWDEIGRTSYVGCLVQDPGGSFRWSMAEAVIENEVVSFMMQAATPAGDPGLFIGTYDFDDRRLHLYRQDLPKTGDPESDILHGITSFVPAADWSVRLSRFNGDDPQAKTFRRWMVEADTLGDEHPDNTIDVLVSTDGGAFVSQGTATDSPRWSGPPVAGSVEGTSAQVRLDVHNDPAHPVIVRSVGAHYSPRPELTRVITYPVLFGEGVTGHDPLITLRRIEQAQREGPIQVTDHLGRIYEGLVEPGFAETWSEDNTRQFTVRGDLTISVTRDQARFDADFFDDGLFS